MTTTPLPQVTTLVAADQILLQGSANGLYETVSASALLSYIQANLTATSVTVQYSAPSATGFSVTIALATSSTWLLLTPTGTLAAGTIVLPASPADKVSVEVTTTQAITALTVSGNGATVTGAPTTLAANGFFKMRYNAVNSSWYRYG